MAENHKKEDRLEPSSPDKKDLGSITRSYQKGWAYSEIAVQYGVAIVLCTLLGNWLDGKFDTGNILMIAGLIVGAVAGFIGMLKQLNALNTKAKIDRRKKT